MRSRTLPSAVGRTIGGIPRAALSLRRLAPSYSYDPIQKEVCMKGLIAWFMGVPLFVVILLYVFGYF